MSGCLIITAVGYGLGLGGIVVATIKFGGTRERFRAIDDAGREAADGGEAMHSRGDI